MKNFLTLTGASFLALTFATDLLAAAPKTGQGKAALKSQIEMMIKRVNELEAKEKAMGNLTEKEVATTGNNLNVKVSGQVNRAILWHADGNNSNTVHVDPSDEAASLLRVNATGKLSESTAVGGTLEMDLRSNRGEFIDVRNANDSNTTFSRRITELFLKSNRWGKVTLGHGWMASARVTRDTDMSATGAVANGDTVGQLAGGTQFTERNASAANTPATNKATTDGGVALDIKAVFNGADNHREDRAQYDTPTFWGTNLSASHAYKGHNDSWDVALKHASTVLGTKIAAQGAYFRNSSNTGAGLPATVSNPAKYTQWSGSVGALFPIGLSVMVATTHRNWKIQHAPKGSIHYAKVGYQQAFFEAGLTALALDYGRFKNMILNRSANDPNIRNKFIGKTYGAYLVQHIDRIGTDVYLAVRNYRLDGETAQTARYNDISTFMSGMRVRF